MMLNEIAENEIPVDEQLFFSVTAQSLLSANLKDEHLINCLLDNHCFSDAITFLAHTLGCKDGISWARKSVSQYGLDLSDNDNYLLSSIENWLKSPTSKNRFCVLPKKTFKQSTPAVWVALAAYWSEGSIDGDNVNSAEAPKTLVIDAVYSAVMLLTQQVPEKDKYRIYISIINDGIDTLVNSRLN